MAKRNNNNGLKNLSLTDLVNMIGKETAQNIFTGEINKINKKIK